MAGDVENKDLLFELLRELSNAYVKFVVCGGVACVLQGVERSTYDLDIAVDMGEENIKKIIKITKKFNLYPRIPEPVTNLLSEQIRNRWLSDKGAFVYTFISGESPLQIDIFLDYPINFNTLLENSQKVEIENFEFLISSKEDLILAKKNISEIRDKDLIDIKELEKLIKDEKKS